MTLTVLVLSFVTLQRLGELVIARRNTARLLQSGAFEVAPEHYPLIVVLHTLWLAGLWYLALTRGLSLDLLLLAIFVVLQGLRIWVLAALGPRWTTRIIVLPGEQLVAKGPYRYLAHPNYWVVIGEILVLPLALGLFWYGIVFSVLNLAVLWLRIRAEDKALGR